MYRQEWLPGGGVAYTSREHGFQTDALRLAEFAFPKNGERVCDLGTGCGSIPLIWLSRGAQVQVDGVDRQEEAVRLAQASVQTNGWQDCFCLWHQDWDHLSLPAGAYDRVVCNPPYFAASTGAQSPCPARRAARQEDSGQGMSGWIRAAAGLLHHGGRLCLCYRPERLTDLLTNLRGAGLEPKRLQWVQHRPDTPAWLLLCEARKGGRPGVQMEPVWLENPVCAKDLVHTGEPDGNGKERAACPDI